MKNDSQVRCKVCGQFMSNLDTLGFDGHSEQEVCSSCLQTIPGLSRFVNEWLFQKAREVMSPKSPLSTVIDGGVSRAMLPGEHIFGNGYFIFDKGANSVANGLVSIGKAVWRLGCWCETTGETEEIWGRKTVAGPFYVAVFTQPDSTVDKFKPSRSIYCVEFRMDTKDFTDIDGKIDRGALIVHLTQKLQESDQFYESKKAPATSFAYLAKHPFIGVHMDNYGGSHAPRNVFEYVRFALDGRHTLWHEQRREFIEEMLHKKQWDLIVKTMKREKFFRGFVLSASPRNWSPRIHGWAESCSLFEDALIESINDKIRKRLDRWEKKWDRRHFYFILSQWHGFDKLAQGKQADEAYERRFSIKNNDGKGFEFSEYSDDPKFVVAAAYYDGRLVEDVTIGLLRERLALVSEGRDWWNRPRKTNKKQEKPAPVTPEVVESVPSNTEEAK